MPDANNKPGILFSFAEMQREITNMALMAGKFLDTFTVATVIPDWLQQLRNFATSAPGSELRWEIPRTRPVTTVFSAGYYDPDDHGEHTVYGTISCVWGIRIPETAGKAQKKGHEHQHFELMGLAS